MSTSTSGLLPRPISIYLVVIACVGVQLAARYENEDVRCRCHNRNISDDMRQKIIDFHNNARLQLAKGEAENRRGKLPSSKNMYKMIWSCNLELVAELALKEGQIKKESIRTGHGVNTYSWYNLDEHKVEFEKDVKPALQRWWDEPKKYGLYDPNNRLIDDELKEFAQMAHGKTTGIGCTYNVHGLFTNIVCVYYNNVKKGQIIYEKGSGPCNRDNDCTTFTDSLCGSNNLCLKLKPTF